MTTQRCIDCLCDTPDGSPSKCAACRERDLAFGPVVGTVAFFKGGRPAKDVDADHDAYCGSSDPLDPE